MFEWLSPYEYDHTLSVAENQRKEFIEQTVNPIEVILSIPLLIIIGIYGLYKWIQSKGGSRE